MEANSWASVLQFSLLEAIVIAREVSATRSALPHGHDEPLTG
jgi:hypothetical protein